jgi:uncharacterized protein
VPDGVYGDDEAKSLAHVTHGREDPTRAARAFLVAKSAIDEGHYVTVFLAGNAAQLIRDLVLDTLSGLATGELREHYNAIVAGGGQLSWCGPFWSMTECSRIRA